MKKLLEFLGNALVCLVIVAVLIAALYYKMKKVEFFLTH